MARDVCEPWRALALPTLFGKGRARGRRGMGLQRAAAWHQRPRLDRVERRKKMNREDEVVESESAGCVWWCHEACHQEGAVLESRSWPRLPEQRRRRARTAFGRMPLTSTSSTSTNTPITTSTPTRIALCRSPATVLVVHRPVDCPSRLSCALLPPSPPPGQRRPSRISPSSRTRPIL
jgi:hypothetical protein